LYDHFHVNSFTGSINSSGTQASRFQTNLDRSGHSITGSFPRPIDEFCSTDLVAAAIAFATQVFLSIFNGFESCRLEDWLLIDASLQKNQLPKTTLVNLLAVHCVAVHKGNKSLPML
jgi:hypothetical protein